MKEKIIVAALTSMVALSLIFAVSAQPPLPPWLSHEIVARAYTEEIQYLPGQQGTLYIVILNYRDQPVEIKNITIYYPWINYDKTNGWIGNYTVIPSSTEKTLSSNGGKLEKEISFSVPNDGKLISGSSTTPYANIYVYDKDGNVVASTYAYINVDVPIVHLTFQDMDKIVMLFTVLVVLLIVCTVIIAATIFLSMRRPQVTWKAAEKAE
jgi:hypothetical protein